METKIKTNAHTFDLRPGDVLLNIKDERGGMVMTVPEVAFEFGGVTFLSAWFRRPNGDIIKQSFANWHLHRIERTS